MNLKIVIRFFLELFVTAALVTVAKSIFEFTHAGTTTDFHWLEIIQHNFIVDGLYVGFVVGIALELLQTMGGLRNDIQTLNQNTAIAASDKIAGTVQQHLTTIDEKYASISEAILKTLRSSNIYVAGVRKADSEMVHMLDECAHYFDTSADGVLILKVSTIEEYSSVCLDLLKMAKKSIWSMSDMGLDQAFMLYSDTSGMSEWEAAGEKVKKWVADVNDKANLLDVKRIQVVNYDRMVLVDCLKSYNKAKVSGNAGNPDEVLNVIRPGLRDDTNPSLRADALLDGWKKYIELYVSAGSENIHWYVYDEAISHQAKDREREKCVTGEFIIIDEKYLIRYSSQTGVLEVLMGRVVEIFASQFENSLLNGLTIINNKTAQKIARLD